MPDDKPDSPDASVEQHVRRILAQITALKNRLRAQEDAHRSGSRDAIEIDRDDDSPGRIDDADLPA